MKSSRSNPGPKAKAAAFHLSATWQQATVLNTTAPGRVVFGGHRWNSPLTPYPRRSAMGFASARWPDFPPELGYRLAIINLEPLSFLWPMYRACPLGSHCPRKWWNARTMPRTCSLGGMMKTYCPYFQGRALRRGIALFPPNLRCSVLRKSVPWSLCRITGWWTQNRMWTDSA